MSQAGQGNTSWTDSYANIYGAAPGGITVTVTAKSAGYVSAPNITTAATATVVAPTAAPPAGTVSGNAVPTAWGTNGYTVTAGGGNGSYSYVWEARHGGGGLTPVHTASGAPSTAATLIVGGRLSFVRVRVTSCTSYGPPRPSSPWMRAARRPRWP